MFETATPFDTFVDCGQQRSIRYSQILATDLHYNLGGGKTGAIMLLNPVGFGTPTRDWNAAILQNPAGGSIPNPMVLTGENAVTYRDSFRTAQTIELAWLGSAMTGGGDIRTVAINQPGRKGVTRATRTPAPPGQRQTPATANRRKPKQALKVSHAGAPNT